MSARIDIIFDLDGTLIDSAPSILDALQKTLNYFSYESKKSLNSELIGPPLKKILQEVSGETDPEKLSLLIEFFKKIYDNETYTLSIAYRGVSELLQALVLDGKRLHIATNKRLVPTQKIAEFFSWERYFQTIYSIDKKTPAYLDKNHMLRSMVTDLSLNAKDCIYVGDSMEDGEAATLNAISFVYVNWGYGSLALEADKYQAVKDISELKELLIGK
jgi:phosphoglycolate phosphatase